jgi:hypothetical protein
MTFLETEQDPFEAGRNLHGKWLGSFPERWILSLKRQLINTMIAPAHMLHILAQAPGSFWAASILLPVRKCNEARLKLLIWMQAHPWLTALCDILSFSPPSYRLPTTRTNLGDA